MRQSTSPRWSRLSVTALLAVAFVLVASHPVWVRPLGAWWISRTLAQRGLEPQIVEVTHLGFDGLVVDRVVLGRGNDVVLSGFRIDWSFAALRVQRVDAVRVDTVQMNVRMQDGAFRVGDLEPLVWRAAGTESYDGEGQLFINGQLAATDGGWSGSAEARFLSDDGSLTIDSSGEVEASSFEVTLSVSVRHPIVPEPLARVDLDIDAVGSVGPEFGRASVRAHADLEGAGLGIDLLGVVPTDLAVELRWQGATVAFEELDWTLGATALEPLGLSAELRGAQLLASGSVESDGDSSWLRIDSCAHFDPGLVRLADARIALERPLCIRQSAGSDALARMRDGGWTLAAELREFDASLQGATGGGSVRLVLPLTRLDLSVEPSLCHLSVEAEGGLVQSSEPPLLAKGIALRVTSASCRATPFDGTLDAARLTSTASPAWFSPAAVFSEFGGGPIELQLSGRAEGIAAPIELRFEARHRPATDNGSATLEIPPLTLGRSSDLYTRFPIAKAALTNLGEVSGTIGVETKLAWAGGALDASPTRLLFADVSARGEFGALVGLEGSVEIADTMSLTTAAPQTVSFERVDLGSPIDNGRLRFTLQESGRIRIDELVGRFAGGAVTVRGEVDPSASSADGIVELSEARIERLLAIAPVEGLEMDGALHVRLPLHVGEQELRVDGATFRAGKGGGVLRYRPESPPESLGSGESRRVILQVLEDFRFETFEGEISGDLSRGIGLRAAVRGESTASPPIPANVTLDLRTRIEGANKLVVLLRALRSARGLETAAPVD